MNKDLKNLIIKNGLFMWEVGKKIGCNDGNFSRKLRKELTNEEKQKIIDAITSLIEEKGSGNHENKNTI